MANYYFGAAGVGGNWSVIGNWWLTEDRVTTPAVGLPGVADTVYFDEVSGDCLLDIDPSVLSFWFDAYGAGGDVFDFNGHTLAFRTRADMDGATSAAAFDMSMAGSTIKHDGTIGTGDFYPYPGMTVARLLLRNETGSNRICRCFRDCSILKLSYFTSSTGRQEFYYGGGQQYIHDIDSTGTGHNHIYSSSSAAGSRMVFRGEARLNWLEDMTGYYGFGHGQDVNIYLKSDLTFLYGHSWYIYNASGSDMTVSFYTPDGQGGLRLINLLKVDAVGTGNIDVDFSSAIMRRDANYGNWPNLFVVARGSPTPDVYIHWGSSNDYGFKSQLDCWKASNFTGSDCSFWLMGNTTMNYVAPSWDPDTLPLYPVLPGDLKFQDYLAGIPHTSYIRYDARIAGDLLIEQTVGKFTLTQQQGTTHVIEGDFRWNKTTEHDSEHHYDNDVEYQGDYMITNSAANVHEILFEDESIDFYGDVAFGSRCAVTLDPTGQLTMHVSSKHNRGFSGAVTGPATFGGTVIFDHDDATDGGGSYDLWIDLQAANVYFYDAIFRTSVDQDWDVEFTASAAIEYAFRDFSHEPATACDPCNIAGSPRTQFKSHTDDTQWHMSLGTVGEDIAFAMFTDCANDGDYFDPLVTLLVRDGTTIDGGNNAGIIWTYTAGSLGICPSDTVSFAACHDAQLPDAQQLTIYNLDSGTLASPVTDVAPPAWLDVTELAETGQRKLTLQPNTTDLAPGLHQDTVEAAAVGALRSPVSIDVEYTISAGVVPVPTPDEVDFYVLRDRTYPASTDVDVVNPHVAVTMAEIEAYDLPAWLDATVNPAGAIPFGDNQVLRLAVNATGTGLPIGTYTARIGVTAANADCDQFIDVTLVVETITMNAVPADVELAMIERKALPAPQVVQLGNSGSGILGAITVQNPTAWLTPTLSGSGNLRFLEVAVNAAALALDPNDYEVDITLLSDADNSPFVVTVKLTVQTRLFDLIPTAVEFVPTARWLISTVQQVRVVARDYAIILPVGIAGAPDWLDVQLDASDLDNQLITLTIIQAAFDQIDDPDEYDQTLLITATGNPAATTLPLPVSIQSPAFFHRPECDMAFIPKIEGTLVEECDVPPPPPPIPITPLVAPPASGGGGYILSSTLTAGPCMTCTMEIVTGGELGFLSPEIVLECTEHGCSELDMTGTYCPEQDVIVSVIELDACGHVCAVTCETDDTGGS